VILAKIVSEGQSSVHLSQSIVIVEIALEIVHQLVGVASYMTPGLVNKHIDIIG
jgi:hypothetical protein